MWRSFASGGTSVIPQTKPCLRFKRSDFKSSANCDSHKSQKKALSSVSSSLQSDPNYFLSYACCPLLLLPCVFCLPGYLQLLQTSGTCDSLQVCVCYFPYRISSLLSSSACSITAPTPIHAFITSLSPTRLGCFLRVENGHLFIFVPYIIFSV